MNYRKQSIRALFFVFVLACLLTGLAGTPRVPARAAPQRQATALSIVINEIGWAGTAASANHEWIELYNPGTSDINLAGWTLQATDGTPNITLSGAIAAGGYYLLERNEAAISDILANLNYAGALSNTGETLQLRDNTNAVIDTANQTGGAWPAGNATGFYSMERIDVLADSPTAWASNNGVVRNGLDSSVPTPIPINGTPKQQNSVTLALTATVIPTITNTPTITLTPTNTLTPTATSTATITPTSVGFLSLLINEVAWAGTAASTSDEWIELYNPGSSPVNLTGWVFRGADGTPNIMLNGVINATGTDRYFLLERTDDTTVSDIKADQFFTGDIGNSGEILQLLDPSNTIIDTANSDGGTWPGNSTTLGSLERRGVIADSETAWITNTGVVRNGRDANNNPINGTPTQPNWALTVTPTASLTPTRTRTPTPPPTKTRTPTPLPPPPLIVINEFVPRPGHDWNGDGIVNVGDEYIELLNHGVIDVDLSGYSLDDEVNIGSNPYVLPAVVLKPGERKVFFGSETGLLLSDGGDGVRLLKQIGELGDAYNYRVVHHPDQAYCRYPDNGGADDWNTNCFPTPGLQNALSGSFVLPQDENEVAAESLCPLSDTQPDDFIWAECQPFGQNIFNPAFWDRTGWFGERYLPESPGKWPVFVD
jgi:hypothetical protein